MNYFTEQEAQQKYCPHLKDKCVATQCMAWRFSHSHQNDKTHEACETGPWDAEELSETLEMITGICGVEIAQELENAPRTDDGDFDRDTELVERINTLLAEHYGSRLDAFKAQHAPQGEGWEENTSWGDYDGMYVEWVKPGPAVGYCGYAR